MRIIVHYSVGKQIFERVERVFAREKTFETVYASACRKTTQNYPQNGENEYDRYDNEYRVSQSSVNRFFQFYTGFFII